MSDSNTKLGTNALKNNKGKGNTAVGKRALLKNTSGIQNTALGNMALDNNIDTHNNVAIGFKSLENSTGNYNTALGALSGNTLTNGKSNVVIGKESDVSRRGATNQIVIGANAKGLRDNTVVLGNNEITNVFMSETKNAELHCILNVHDSEGKKVYSLPNNFKNNTNRVLKVNNSKKLEWDF